MIRTIVRPAMKFLIGSMPLFALVMIISTHAIRSLDADAEKQCQRELPETVMIREQIRDSFFRKTGRHYFPGILKADRIRMYQDYERHRI